MNERGFSVLDNGEQRIQRKIIAVPVIRQNYHSQERHVPIRQISQSPPSRYIVYGEAPQYFVRNTSNERQMVPMSYPQPMYYSVAAKENIPHESSQAKELKEAEIKNLENRIMILLNENSSLNAVLNSKIEEVNVLTAKISTYQPLVLQFREAEKKILHLSNELALANNNSVHMERAREKIVALEKELVELKSRNQIIGTENAELHSELVRVSTSSKASEKVLSLQSELEKAFAEIEYWRGKHSSLENEQNRKYEENEKLREEVKMLASEVSYLKANHSNLKEKNLSLTEQLENLEFEANSMRPKSLELLALIVSLAAEVESLRSLSISSQGDIDSSRKRRKSSELVKMRVEGRSSNNYFK